MFGLKQHWIKNRPDSVLEIVFVHFFWTCSAVFRHRFCRLGEALAIFCQTLPFQSALLIPVLKPTVISCQPVLQLLFITGNTNTRTFPAFCGPSPNFPKQPLLFMKWLNVSLNTWYVVYVLLWIKRSFVRFANHCIALFPPIFVSQLYQNWVCK